ncbi:MAG: SEC-C domain-containing protein [Desulfobulbaceae bacterium]|nr:SEC-C domain-containing protein [Desulfobulbaceae bacterium]
MAKIGRNERCPCGSGKKYKHCCARSPRTPVAPVEPGQGILTQAVERICRAAGQRRQVINELGVFVLFATERGNAWLLEVTQSDCVQVARDGQPVSPEINENPETIEVEWSHTFRVVDRQLVLTAYSDRSEQVLEDCPVREVSAAVRRVAKKFPPSVRQGLHIDPGEQQEESPAR